jgi:damage-control phosphatase, subfamily I
MKLQKSCYHCLKEFACKIGCLATSDEKLRDKAVNSAVEILDKEFSPNIESLGLAARIFHSIRQMTANDDPYLEVKKAEIVIGQEMFNELSSGYDGSLTGLLKLAALGNSPDFFKPHEDLRKDMRKKVTFARDESAKLETMIRHAGNILYMADNAGEPFFDIPLLNYMRQFARVIYVVKPSPIQNDVTIADIKHAGLIEKIGETMTTGAATAGIVFSMASPEFIDKFKKADLVFAKGMGYYESLSEFPEDKRIFYCLKAKCQPVADSLRVPLDSFVAMVN